MLSGMGTFPFFVLYHDVYALYHTREERKSNIEEERHCMIKLIRNLILNVNTEEIKRSQTCLSQPIVCCSDFKLNMQKIDVILDQRRDIFIILFPSLRTCENQHQSRIRYVLY